MLLEYAGRYRREIDESCIAEAETLFWNIVEWIKNPGLLGRPAAWGTPLSSLANHMVLMSIS